MQNTKLILVCAFAVATTICTDTNTKKTTLEAFVAQRMVEIQETKRKENLEATLTVALDHLFDSQISVEEKTHRLNEMAKLSKDSPIKFINLLNSLVATVVCDATTTPPFMDFLQIYEQESIVNMGQKIIAEELQRLQGT